MVRFASIVVALVLGALLPGISPWFWLIRWFLVVMLFSTFLDLDPRSARPGRAHGRLLLLWPLLAAGGWLILRPFGETAALAGFLVGATPTATAAPAVTRLLGGRIGFVTVSVIGSNLLAAFLLPTLLATLPGTVPGAVGDVRLDTLYLIGFPLMAAQGVRFILPRALGTLRKLRHLTFPMWVTALALASARTSEFLRAHPEIPRMLVVAIFAGAGLICAANFLLGRFAGRPGAELEAGQSLGQKNTMLTLWLGTVAAGPVAALGPASYVVWHNLWNGIQLSRRRK